MSAEQTPDIERVLAEHRHPGEFLAGLGDAWLVCSCGERIDLPVSDGKVNKAEVARLFEAHQAQALAPVLAAAVREAEQRALRERVEALRPAAWTIPSDLCGGEVGEWIEVIRLDRLWEALDAADGHRCSTCVDCLHDGHKCCGCYDGACCQTGDVRADRVAEPQHEAATSNV